MKTMQKMLAMSLICGGALLSSCSDDSSSSNSPQAPQAQVSKEQAAFVEKTREDLKEIASNLNFNSWKLANSLNQGLNEYVLNNPEIENAVTGALLIDVLKTMTPVDKDSDLGKEGKEYMATVDLAKFNYRFTLGTDAKFKVAESDNFEMVFAAWNPETEKLEADKFKVSLKMGGSSFKVLHNIKALETLALVMVVPADVSFAISVKENDKWNDLFTGEFKNEAKLKDGTEYFDKMTSVFNVSGKVNASLPALEKDGKKMAADNATIDFAVGQDPSTHKSTLKFSFVHNDKKVVAVSAENKRDGSEPVDLSMLPNSSSIIDLFAALIEGQSIESLSITLMDNLEISVKVSDRDELLAAQRAMNEARRNYADKSTIDAYTKKMNEYVTASFTAKGLEKEVPMKFETVQFGVDFLAMPSMMFNEDEGYVPLTDVLDQETLVYGINIIDHAADPMAETIVVVRQLLQYFNLLMGTYDLNEIIEEKTKASN